MLVKVSPKGQITIPKEMRQQFAIEPGDILTIFATEDGLVLQPVTETIFDLAGTIPVPEEGPLTIAAIRESAGRYIAESTENDES